MSGARANTRVTVSVSADLLRKVDASARGSGRTRSVLVDAWLRRAARLEAEQTLANKIAAYYDDVSDAERTEAAEWARFSTESFVRRERERKTTPVPLGGSISHARMADVTKGVLRAIGVAIE